MATAATEAAAPSVGQTVVLVAEIGVVVSAERAAVAETDAEAQTAAAALGDLAEAEPPAPQADAAEVFFESAAVAATAGETAAFVLGRLAAATAVVFVVSTAAPVVQPALPAVALLVLAVVLQSAVVAVVVVVVGPA